MEWIFDNIIQTRQGLRLVDTGFSCRFSTAKGKYFVHTLLREQREITSFKEYYLSL